MAWADSKIFMSFFEDCFENTAARDIDTDTHKAALYNNTTAPNQADTTANCTYNVGTWATANEVTDGTNWDAAGEPLTGVSSAFTSNVYKFDATDTPQSGATCTLANVYGTLVYNSTTAARGVSYHYFGGVQSVTAGTFTIIWNASGILTVTA